MDTDPGSIIIKIVTLFALIFVNAFFSMSEMAIVTLNDNKIDKMAEQGNKKAKQIKKLTENTSSFLSTIQIGVTLAGFLTSATAAQSFAEMLTNAIAKTPVVNVIPVGIISGFSTVVITLIMSYFSLVLGELVPKKIAMSKPEKMAFMAAPILVFVAKITKPIVKFLALSTNGVLRLIGIDPHADEEVVTEEEIRMMVDVGGEKGVIEDTQIEMINNIFEFDDISISEVCTHRRDVAILYREDDIDEWKKTLSQSRHGYYPVCGESADEIIGVLNIKKFFRAECKSVDEAMRVACEKAYFVPENMKADVLFTNMKETRNYFAVVVDEYGGTSGVITIHDLLELLVGDMDDKDEVVVEEIVCLDEETRQWRILGSASLEKIAEELDVEFEAEDCDTFGGYIFGILGEIPDDGTTLDLETDDLIIKVESVLDHRIESTTVTVKEKVDEEDEDDRKKSRDKDEKESDEEKSEKETASAEE